MLAGSLVSNVAGASSLRVLCLRAGAARFSSSSIKVAHTAVVPAAAPPPLASLAPLAFPPASLLSALFSSSGISGIGSLLPPLPFSVRDENNHSVFRVPLAGFAAKDVHVSLSGADFSVAAATKNGDHKVELSFTIPAGLDMSEDPRVAVHNGMLEARFKKLPARKLVRSSVGPRLVQVFARASPPQIPFPPPSGSRLQIPAEAPEPEKAPPAALG
jgi:hypothetical protein